MKVSKKFLNDYVSISDVDFHDVAEKMVFVGNEYETIGKISEATGVVVGYVQECVKHPDSSKLSICQVDVGSEVRQILCGAPNVRAGIYVVVALDGAVLPNGVVIKKAKLAGMESNGMICSLGELGIESKYQSEEDKSGIHVLTGDVHPGDDAIVALGYDDEVIDFELTANRGDLLSMLGMAYEVGAIYRRDVNLPATEVEMTNENIMDVYHLDVQTEKCPMYTGKLVRNVEIKESPKFIQNRLMASGIRPINNVVDISNYVMLEYGQPLHFFDADLLGNHVMVRNASDGEELVTLDGNKRALESSDIVIANENEAVGLAGVMGGFDTEITDNTKNIFIESAIFDPTSIRLTSKKILRSEASNRYEKGIDPSRTIPALNRACYLLHKYANAEVTSGIVSHDTLSKEDKKISVSLDKIKLVLGMELSVSEVTDVFEALHFGVEVHDDVFAVSVPTRRMDISIPEDLIEEVGRIYGYDHIVGKLPIFQSKKGGYSKKGALLKQIRNRFLGMGLQQVRTYSLVREDMCDQFVDVKRKRIVLLDPMSEDKKAMRQSLIPSLLQVWEYNVARHMKNICIFEIGSAYYEMDDYTEETKLSGLLYGQYLSNSWAHQNIKVDFYVVKGMMENLLDFLGLKGRYHFVTDLLLDDLHPGCSCAVEVDRDVVGYFGQVHPSMYHGNDPVYVFELSFDQLMKKQVRSIKYKEISKYPVVHKDVAFVLPKSMSALEVITVIKKSGGRLLNQVEVFDVYEGENVLENEKSLAFALTFSDPTRTLTDEEVNTLFYHIIGDVESKLGGKLRNQ